MVARRRTALSGPRSVSVTAAVLGNAFVAARRRRPVTNGKPSSGGYASQPPNQSRLGIRRRAKRASYSAHSPCRHVLPLRGRPVNAAASVATLCPVRHRRASRHRSRRVEHPTARVHDFTGPSGVSSIAGISRSRAIFESATWRAWPRQHSRRSRHRLDEGGSSA